MEEGLTMLRTLALLLTLAADPSRTALDRAWEQVENGSGILSSAIEQRPLIAKAAADTYAASDRQDIDRLVDDIMVDDEVEAAAKAMVASGPFEE
jgi:hypothetical protein